METVQQKLAKWGYGGLADWELDELSGTEAQAERDRRYIARNRLPACDPIMRMDEHYKDAR